jgi:hypothetical protein
MRPPWQEIVGEIISGMSLLEIFIGWLDAGSKKPSRLAADPSAIPT